MTCKHAYNLNKYSRDDSGFFLDCVHCGQTSFFDCDSEDELYDLFGINDDEDGYDERDYEEE